MDRDLKSEVKQSALDVIAARYDRVKNRWFAPFRLMRFLRFQKLIKKIEG